MYKTVRQGENSLQYTILPQQDDSAGVGVRASSSRRHRRKGKTAAVLAVTVVLICGVIATAILVPLLLTNDLVALPAAFHQFSVASMHTVRVGSHKEIIAKRPPDWEPHHVEKSTTTTTTTSKTTSTSTTSTTLPPPPTTQQDDVFVVELTSPKPPATTLPPTTTTSPAATTTHQAAVSRAETHKTELQWRYTLSSNGNINTAERIPVEPIATRAPWYHFPKFQWSILQNNDRFLIPVLAGGGIITLFIMAATIMWLKRRSKRANENVTADKESLLTDPAALSEDEQ